MPIFPLITAALRARKQAGTGLWRQLWQAGQLRYGSSKLDPWEYYFFRVYHDCYSPEEKRRFIGWRREIQLDRLANGHEARLPANNKLVFHQLLTRHELPLPKIFAVYGTGIFDIPGAASLNDTDSIETFLVHAHHEDNGFPIFIKPVRGSQGKHTYRLNGLINGKLDLSTGQQPTVTDFTKQLEPLRKSGVLFQELLRPASDTESICGRRLTSVRFLVIVLPTGPEILSAVWRVPTGNNVTDNFSCGLNGNLIAGIDLDSGRIEHTVRGIGWNNIPTSCHPDTGMDFNNLILPDWKKACTLCLNAALLFPDLRLQHWDIALTDRGPVFMEINVEGGMRTHQIVNQCGIFSPRLEKLATLTGAD